MKRMRYSSPRNMRVPRTARNKPDTVTTTPTRSALPLHNLQEHLDAGASASRTARVGAAQYFTPQWFAELMAKLCPGVVSSGLDLQSGNGALVRALSLLGGQSFGVEIDPRAAAAADAQSGGLNRPLTIVGNCVRFAELWHELFTDLHFSHVAVNPPFSLLFKTGRGSVDSTLWTWENAITMAGRNGTGFMIANADTIERLKLHSSKAAWLYQRFPSGIFPDANVEIGVLHFHGSHDKGPVKRVRYSTAKETQVRSEVAIVMAELMKANAYGTACPISSVYGSDRAKILAAFDTIRAILAEERSPKSAFNIWLDKRGRLATYLSTYEKLKRDLTAKDIERLASINNAHPLALTPEKETRELLRSLVEDGTYTIEPKAVAAIRAALEECKTAAVPIMPVTDFQRVAYADEEEMLVAAASTSPLRVVIQHGLTDATPRRPYYQADVFGRRFLAQAGRDGTWHGYVMDLEAKDQPFIGEPTYLGHAQHGKAWVEREVGRRMPTLTKGKAYPITTGTYEFVNRYERMKLHLGGGVGTYAAKHNLTLSGADRYIQLHDDKGRTFRFMDRPGDGNAVFTELADARLWQLFESPDVPTVADKFPELYQQNLALLASIEDLAGFRYYDGQRGYLARVAIRDGVLIGAETGTGKSLMCITLFQMKGARRGLIVAPQGTTRADEEDEGEGDMTPSQWISELRRFAPGISVFELFSPDDYERILALNDGELPPGLYVSYYEAMFSNGAREHLPKSGSFDDARLLKECRLPHIPGAEGEREFCEGIGDEVNGLRCIARPTLATRIGHLFDFVGLDEAHKAQKLSSQVTQQIIRLQPRYRFAFTATPIPNIVTDIFPLMGWILVPGWHEGGRRNAAWPYAREEGGRFSKTFLCTERDLTQEAMNREADPKWRGKCEKVAPTISAPARLLKLLTPGMAYISKLACNPNLPPRHVHDVRVPMGAQQAKLYGYYMNRANVPGKDAMEKAAKQVAILRDLCAHPATSRWNNVGTLTVRSQFNPKAAAILGLVAKIVSAGRQVVIVNARVGQTDLLANKLREAGVSFARIDSSLTPDRHTA